MGGFASCQRPVDRFRSQMVLFGYFGNGFVFVFVNGQKDFIVYEIHVDYPVDGRFFFSYRAFDGGNFCGTLGYEKYTDLFFRNPFVDEFFPYIYGCRIHDLLQSDNVVDQGREPDLYQPDDSRTGIRDKRFQVGVFLHVFPGFFCQNAGGFVHFHHIVKTHIM